MWTAEKPLPAFDTLSLHDALPIFRADLTELGAHVDITACDTADRDRPAIASASRLRSRLEEHTSELQARRDLVCRLVLEMKKCTPLRAADLTRGYPILRRKCL